MSRPLVDLMAQPTAEVARRKRRRKKGPYRMSPRESHRRRRKKPRRGGNQLRRGVPMPEHKRPRDWPSDSEGRDEGSLGRHYTRNDRRPASVTGLLTRRRRA